MTKRKKIILIVSIIVVVWLLIIAITGVLVFWIMGIQKKVVEKAERRTGLDLSSEMRFRSFEINERNGEIKLLVKSLENVQSDLEENLGRDLLPECEDNPYLQETKEWLSRRMDGERIESFYQKMVREERYLITFYVVLVTDVRGQEYLYIFWQME